MLLHDSFTSAGESCTGYTKHNSFHTAAPPMNLRTAAIRPLYWLSVCVPCSQLVHWWCFHYCVNLCRALRDDSELVHVPVSVDTFHSRVAQEAVAAGADMINDVTGGQHDQNMLRTVARLGVPYCLMHLRGDLAAMTQAANTTYSCVWSDVGDALRQRAQQAVEAGILPWNLVLDPGLGFSKTSEGNAQLLGHLQQMRRETLRGVWGRMPLLVGPSRKRFIGKLTGTWGYSISMSSATVSQKSCNMHPLTDGEHEMTYC